MEEQIIMERLNKIEQNLLLAAKRVLNINDVAALTGLNKSYIYKLTCRKEIPYYKPNGKVCYFDRKEIEEWQKQNRVATRAEADMQAAKYIMEKGN